MAAHNTMSDDAREKSMSEGFLDRLQKHPLVNTAAIRAFGLTQIPMLWFLRPSVVETTDNRTVIKIALTRRTRNHLRVMYIGALVAGADMAAGLTAMRRIKETGAKVHLLFKDMQVDFLKRVDGDAHFVCEDGPGIRAAVERAVQTGERVNHPVPVVALVPSSFGDEPVAKFTMTLTLKKRD